MDGIKGMEGKKVFVELKNGRRYTGRIISIDTNLDLVQLLDKFAERVWFSLREIKVLQEERP